ncbi:leucine-rich repeat-containing protein 74A, partial [Biomphalaria glabrata]
PVQKPSIDDVKKSLYQRECTKLGITPVGSFLRSPTRTELRIRHYSLGPEGARALAVPLM